MAQISSCPELSTLDSSILADLHDLSIRPDPEVPQARQNKGRSNLYNKLYPHEKNPICPRQRDSYIPGEDFGVHICPYSKFGLCADYAPPCRRSSNGSTVPTGERRQSDLQFASGCSDLSSTSTRSDLLDLSSLDPSILPELNYDETGIPKCMVPVSTSTPKKSKNGPSQQFGHKPSKGFNRITSRISPVKGSRNVRFQIMDVPKANETEANNLENQRHDHLLQNNKICPRQEKHYNRDQSRICEDDQTICVDRTKNITKPSNQRRKRGILRRNRPPSGPPSPPHSHASEGRNRWQKQAASRNRKLSARVKPNKKSAFTLTDEQKALVLDNYYPGLIHDAVNQKADFNEIAKQFVTPETAVDGDKAEKGMSLIEAFDTRIKYEQINSTKLLDKIPETVSKAKKGAKPYKPVYGPLAHPVVSDILLEDNVRASAIPIDLQHYVRATPESDPIRAIACLSRAQQLNDYYKGYKAAQAAANLAPPSKIEEAALEGVKSFIISSLSAETKSVDTGSYKSLELISYVGVTKPD